jgi:hypothetical protein
MVLASSSAARLYYAGWQAVCCWHLLMLIFWLPSRKLPRCQSHVIKLFELLGFTAAAAAVVAVVLLCMQVGEEGMSLEGLAEAIQVDPSDISQHINP